MFSTFFCTRFFSNPNHFLCFSLTDKEQSSGLISMTDELLNLVQTLHVCVCEAAQVSSRIHTALPFCVTCIFSGETLLIVLMYTRVYLSVFRTSDQMRTWCWILYCSSGRNVSLCFRELRPDTMTQRAT